MNKAARLALAASTSLFVSGTALAAPCTSARLSAYVALGSGGCSVGALTFSDFSIAAFPGPTAQQIAAGGISLAPVAGGLALRSDGSISAAAGDLLGLRFLFDVAASALTGATVSFGSAASASGDGALTGLLDAGVAGTAIALVIDGFADTPESFTSAPANFYAAFFELGIDGGTFGAASLGPELASLTFTTVAAPVPEPSVAALSLIGLAGLFGARLRRNRRA